MAKLRMALVVAVVMGVVAIPVLAAPVDPTDLNYVGAYRPSRNINAYNGRGALGYYDDPVEGDVLYCANDDAAFVDTIATPLLPSVVGWGELNSASQLLPAGGGAPVDYNPNHANFGGKGIRIRNNGSPDWKVYYPGYNGHWGQTDIDLGNPTDAGDSGSHIDGAATHGLPTGFIEYVVGDNSKNDHDTLVLRNHNGALRFELAAPQSASPPTETTLMWFLSGTPSLWEDSYVACEWVQDEGDAWTDAHIAVLEYDDEDDEWRIVFYDPTKVADADAGDNNENAVGPLDLVDDPSHIIVLEDMDNFGHSAGFNSASDQQMYGLTYDPAKKLLYITENTSDSGAEGAEADQIIHVFSLASPDQAPVAEPTGLSLLGLALLGLKKRRS